MDQIEPSLRLAELIVGKPQFDVGQTVLLRIGLGFVKHRLGNIQAHCASRNPRERDQQSAYTATEVERGSRNEIRVEVRADRLEEFRHMGIARREECLP